jgi:hypothetical protein
VIRNGTDGHKHIQVAPLERWREDCCQERLISRRLKSLAPLDHSKNIRLT